MTIGADTLDHASGPAGSGAAASDAPRMRPGHVRIGGYRVDLRHVQKAIEACEGVEQAAVVPVDARDGALRLAGYVVPETVDPLRVRRHLRGALPSYMIPAGIAAVAALPAAADRLDRFPEQDLPDWRLDRATPAHRLLGPKEVLLARIWVNLLRVTGIGRHDDFFELGGDSFSVIELVLRLRALGDELDVRTVLEHPVLADLAARLSDAAVEAGSTLLPTVEQDSAPLNPERYFGSVLAGFDEPTAPFMIAAAATPQGPRRTTTIDLDSGPTARLHDLAAQLDVCPAALIHAAWALVLARCSGQDDVVFGAPTLPLRLRLADRSVRGAVLEADRQLRSLVACPSSLLGLAQDCSAVAPPLPLFMTALDCRRQVDYPATEQVPQLTDTACAVAARAHAVDDRLQLSVHCAAVGGLDAERLAAYFQAAVQAIVQALEADAAAPLLGLDILPAAERRLLSRDWNDTAVADPEFRTLAHRRFEAQALRAADAPAIVDASGIVSYGELDRRANRLAATLRARGAGRGQLIGLCLHRGVTMVVAQLAILKAGAAYVPLDPAYPADRLSYMADDADLALLVTESTLAGLVPWPQDRTLVVDADSIGAIGAIGAGDAEAEAAAKAAATPQPDDPAYVIYTSGSTGKPKGVVVPHGAVANFIASMSREPGLDASDRLLAVTTLSFDIAVLELLLPLSVGAQIVLASRDESMSGMALRRLIEERQVTVMQATPSTWRLLIDAGWTGSSNLKALIGGEALSPELATELLSRTGGLWNMYGPTETTVWSTCWRVVDPAGGISIGAPIANTSVHILDARGGLCPVGVPGEIHIGGDGVTLGYWNRPDLTGERFIRDPFRQATGARLYRTGDRGCWRADGRLLHLGRLDHQVKLRGYRIELGEIEAAVESHPDVAQCIAQVRCAADGEPRLVAYLLPRVPGAATEPQQLQAHLRSSLPAYMVPQHIVALETVPLLPNGKVDRKALPDPDWTPRSADAAGEPPRGQVEITLADLWREVLQVETIGRHDDFFDLGGHSLAALKLLNRIEQHFDRKLRLAFLFEAPTVALQAAVLQQAEDATTSRCVIPIQPGGSLPPLYFVSGWGGPILLLQSLAKSLGDDQPLYLLDFLALAESIGEDLTIERVAAGLIEDLQRVQPQGPYHLAGYSLGAPIVYEMGQQLLAAGHSVPVLALLDRFAPGHPQIPPFLVRTLLHLREALKKGPVGMWPYLAFYTRRLKRLFVKEAPNLYPELEREEAATMEQLFNDVAGPLADASDTYRIKPLPGRLMFIRSDDLSESGIGTVETDPSGGWSKWAEQVESIGSVPGKHSEMLFERHSTRLAELLARCMRLGRSASR